MTKFFRKIICLLVVALMLSPVVMAQTTEEKAKLEQERNDLLKEIEQLKSSYDKIKGEKSTTISQVNVLKRKIYAQEKYLSVMNRQLRMIDDDIYNRTLALNAAQKELDTLRAQYAKSIVYAYKNRSTFDYLNFIFSSYNFNDALKRISYLKSYRTYRENQINQIQETTKQIEAIKQQQILRKEQKNIVIENKTQQISVLENQKKEKDLVVKQLKQKEKTIQSDLVAKNKRSRDLQNKIAAIVKKELAMIAEKERKAREEANKKNANTNKETANTSSTKYSNNTGEYKDFNSKIGSLNADFTANRGKLPWPVDGGFVKLWYGVYVIDGTNLKGNNPGLTIRTPHKGDRVKAVFNGEVVSIFPVENNLGVVIRHGEYFTVYSNLSSVSVKQGDTVGEGKTIGKTATDDENSDKGMLDFILMYKNRDVDPRPWLSP